MKKITKKAARDAVEVGYESDDSWHNAQSNAQNKMHQIKIYLPMFKGIFGEKPGAYLLHAKDWFDCQGVRYDQEKVHNFEHTLYLKPKNGMLTFSRKLLEGQHGLHLKMHIPLLLYVGKIPEASL